MIAATEDGNIASIVTDSKLEPLSDFPAPRAIALSIVALGNPAFLAAAMSAASRGFDEGSAPYTAPGS